MRIRVLFWKITLACLLLAICVYSTHKSGLSRTTFTAPNEIYNPKYEDESEDKDAVLQSNQESMFKKSYQQNFDPSTKSRRTKAILLVSQIRSDSSFVGELFNQRAGVAYFYEPLYLFGSCPMKRKKPVVAEYFNHTLHFDFEGAYSLYKREYSQSLKGDVSGCLGRGTCFMSGGKRSIFLSRDAKVCKENGAYTQSCPPKFNLTDVSEAVKKSSHIAFKMVYLCNFAEIKQIFKSFEFDIRVVHLVRDPRAILNSRLRSNKEMFSENHRSSRAKVQTVCVHLNQLLDSLDNEIINSGRYMRVRHEDISLEPIKWTKKIYNFVGLTFNSHEFDWLKNATSSKNSSKLSKTTLFGTTRNSEDAISHWRKELDFEDILRVQDLCKSSLKRLGYISFNNSAEPLNFNISSFST